MSAEDGVAGTPWLVWVTVVALAVMVLAQTYTMGLRQGLDVAERWERRARACQQAK